MDATPSYWFRAKASGLGWGIPATWQGWVVLFVWLGAFLDGWVLLRRHTVAHLTFALLMIALLIGICYLKGEPLRWRRGV